MRTRPPSLTTILRRAAEREPDPRMRRWLLALVADEDANAPVPPTLMRLRRRRWRQAAAK